MMNRLFVLLTTAVFLLLSLAACAQPTPVPTPTIEPTPTAVPLPLQPFSSEISGIPVSGVAPADWEEFTAGTFVRDMNSDDQTAIVHQVVGNDASAEDFLTLFSAGIGLDVSQAVSETVSLNGRVWDIYNAEINDQATDIALARDGAFTFFVVMVTPPEEHDLLKEQVLLPALEGMSVP